MFWNKSAYINKFIEYKSFMFCIWNFMVAKEIWGKLMYGIRYLYNIKKEKEFMICVKLWSIWNQINFEWMWL